METNTETAILAPETFDVERLQNIVQKAPEILAENQESHDKAIKYGESLLGQATQNGMSDNLDILMSKYLDKLRITYKTINERRKPFTQIVDEVKKRFTTLESDIDPAGKTNVFAQIQGFRNQFVAAKMEEQRRLEREAADKLKKEKAIIALKQTIEVEIKEKYSEYLTTIKSDLNNILEYSNSYTINDCKKRIEDANEDFCDMLFLKFKNEIITNHALDTQFTSDEIKLNATEICSSLLYEVMKNDFKREIASKKIEVIDKIPSKKTELEELAKADEAEKARLNAEAEKRRKDDEAKLKAEQEARNNTAKEDASVQAAAATVEAAVDSQATLFNEAPKAKEGVEILVKNMAAYALIFQFWLEKEGKGLTSEKVEKMTVGRMKKFCEDWTLKHGETIASPFIEYKEIFKAK